MKGLNLLWRQRKNEILLLPDKLFVHRGTSICNELYIIPNHIQYIHFKSNHLKYTEIITIRTFCSLVIVICLDEKSLKEKSMFINNATFNYFYRHKYVKNIISKSTGWDYTVYAAEAIDSILFRMIYILFRILIHQRNI